VSLARVLDHVQAVAPGDCAQGIHVRGLAVQVHRNDRSRPFRDGCTDAVGIERVGLRIDVDEHGSCTDMGDGKDRGDERVRRGYDFVTRADVERSKGELQRGETGIHADGVRAFAVVAELCFEEVDVLA
jgi:hypothetical protein